MDWINVTAGLMQKAGVCDCQDPEPESGVALVSMECPVHNWSMGGLSIPDEIEEPEEIKMSLSRPQSELLLLMVNWGGDLPADAEDIIGLYGAAFWSVFCSLRTRGLIRDDPQTLSTYVTQQGHDIAAVLRYVANT